MREMFEAMSDGFVAAAFGPVGALSVVVLIVVLLISPSGAVMERAR